MRETLHAAFHRPSTRAHGWVEGGVWGLIVVSMGLLAVEEMLPEGHAAVAVVRWLDDVVLALFGAELGLRVLTYRPPELGLFRRAPVGLVRTHVLARARFLLTPFMLIDLVTVLALVPALRGLRVLRVLRLLRSGKVFRYASPFEGVLRAFEADRLLFVFGFTLLGLQTVLGGVSLFLVERGRNQGIESVADGLWWALVTITTVGFGDITPETGLGRIIGGTLMVGGMFTLALFAGIVGHSLLNAVLSIREEQFRMSTYVNHIVVCGYSSGTRLLLDTLAKEVDLEERQVVLFAEGERPHDVPPQFVWVRGDPTKESELDKVRMTHAATVVLVGDRSVSPQQADAATILTAFTIRSYMARHEIAATRHTPLHVVAEILDTENVTHARTAGADEIIETHHVGFSLLAHAVAFQGTASVATNVVLAGAHNIYVGRFPEGLESPTTYGRLFERIKAAHPALLVGVREPGAGVDRINPPDATEVTAEAHIIYIAERACLPPP